MTLTVERIHIRALRVQAHIGVHDHEHGRTQALIVNIEADVPGAAGAERLGDTLDYTALADAARDLAAREHILLVETFTARLLAAVLALPGVARARVSVDKPGALPDADAASVELAGERL